MTATPPPLSAASAERMQAVVEAADDAVESGMAPDAAIAKAAAAAGLPFGHVPPVVQAFNTARAVYQLGARDVWDKAAAYPTASVDGVRKLLAGSLAPPPAEKRSCDYDLPPDFAPPREPAPYVTPVPADLLKAAAAADRPPEPPRPAPNRTDALFKAAAAYDAAAKMLVALPPPEYAAVRAMAAALHPGAAGLLRDVDAARPGGVKAAASPAVGRSHPALAAVAKYAAAARAVPPETPPLTLRPVAPPPPPLLGGPVLTGAKAAADGVVPSPAPVPPVPAGAPTDLIPPVPGTAGAGAVPPPPVEAGPFPQAPAAAAVKSAAPGGPVGKTPAPGFLSTLGGSLGSTVGTGVGLMASNRVVGPALSSLHMTADRDRAYPGLGGEESRLRAELGRLDDQSNLQSLMEDRRFSKADPRVVIQTYQQLRSIAPRAMANPAVASDFVHRRLLTGPLGAFDLETLSRIESNIAKSQSPRPWREDDD